MLSPTDIEKEVGSLIIGNLNRDGYLQLSVESISEQSGISIEMVEDVLETIQSFDPVGVCARDLRECLLLQARLLNLDNSLVTDIISDHLKNLENKNYKAICKALKVKIKDVVAAVSVIRTLEPKPGRQFNEETPHYIIPDIYVYKSEGDFVIVLNDDGMPKLRVNPFYKRAITRKNEVSANAKDYIRDKMRSAAWLIRKHPPAAENHLQSDGKHPQIPEGLFRQRGGAFKTHGAQGCSRRYRHARVHHQPRVTTNKYTHTPQGIFELKYFFNSSIKRVHGEDIASASVQAKIKKIIEGENPKKPYSDSKMAEMLKTDNIDIARRTVAKYREMMGILSSSKRKQF